MDTLLRFGGGNQLYVFTPDHQISYRDNFADLVPRTSRIPGVDGGFNEFGSEAPPKEIGNVQMVMWLYADTPAEMTAKQDAIRAMASYGTKRLYKEMVGGGLVRWCEAYVNNIDMPQHAADLPRKRQRIQINFQVPNPFWFTQGTEAPRWGDGGLWGGGGVWGGTATAHSVSGTDNTFSETPAGNAITIPRITVKCGAGQTASNIRIRRLVNNVTVDEVAYAGTLAANDELIINCRAKSVKLAGADAYDNNFTIRTASWFRLLPLENTIQVLMDNAGDAASVYVRYYEAYT